MRFSQDFIERVREGTNIVEIISQSTQLKRAGTHRLMGLCPFHNEKTPSFSVSEDKQMYHCFGCKRAGNVYTFIQEARGLSFPEAVEFLAERAGIPIPREAMLGHTEIRAEDSRRDLEKRLYHVNQFAADFFHDQLLAQSPSSRVRKYLEKRGLSEETITRFQLGYAPADWEVLVPALDRAKIAVADAEAVGLVRRRTEGRTGHYDNFRDRLMFPILAPTGQVLGFGGRVLDDSQPKYLNSPESEIFHKGRVLYGLYESAKYIRVEDRVVVVEGYMDYLALAQAGCHSVVATLGTALTPEHARLLKRYTKQIVVLFDGDEAGQEAAARSLPLLLNESLTPRGLVLPNELDPDDFVRAKGRDELENSIASAPELFWLIFDRFLKGYRGGSAEKVALIDKIAPSLHQCRDLRLKELYIRDVADRLGVEAEWLAKALKEPKENAPARTAGVSSPQGSGPQKPGISAPPASNLRLQVKGAPKAELYLLNLALMKNEYYQSVMSGGAVAELSHEGVRRVFTRLEQLYGQMPNKFDNLTALLVAEVDPPETVSLHLKTPLADLSEEGAEKLLADCTRKIRETFLRAKSRQLRADLRGQDSKEQLEKLEQIMNIHRSRQLLNKDT